ncbi:MAG: ATP-binding protein [Vulcanimicrobiota bacterium]
MKAPPTVIDAGVQLTSSLFEHFDCYYQEYLLYGSFPGVVARESKEEKLMILNDIFTSYFSQEVRQLGDFRKTGVIRNLMLLLMERAGSQLDIQKLSSELGVSRETVYHYLAFLEQTYFISLIRPFTQNRDSEIRKAPKCYVCDTGMARHFSRADEGSLFENAVFQSLRTSGELHYYRKKSGAEIDFIVNRRSAYEVKLTAREEDIRKLKKTAESLGLEEYSVISRKFYPHDHVSYGFMLQLSE